MFAAIGLGIGSDYALHLGDWFHLHARGAAAATAQCATGGIGASILTSAAAVCGAMSVLMLSASPPNRMLGLLIMLCLACCAVITLVAFPAMVQVTRRRR
jgi:predicted RND superfamily exporter protein